MYWPNAAGATHCGAISSASALGKIRRDAVREVRQVRVVDDAFDAEPRRKRQRGRDRVDANKSFGRLIVRDEISSGADTGGKGESEKEFFHKSFSFSARNPRLRKAAGVSSIREFFAA
jgi:hypothetical protein